MVAHPSPASVLPVLWLALAPTALLLLAWNGLRSRRTRRHRKAAMLMAQAAEQFARGGVSDERAGARA